MPEKYYPHPTKKTRKPSRSTAVAIGSISWTAIDIPNPFPSVQIWKGIAEALRSLGIPPKKYKGRFFKLRDIDKFWLNALWLNRFTDTYLKLSVVPLTPQDHQNGFESTLKTLEEHGAEHFLELYAEFESAIHQCELSGMGVIHE